MEYSKRLEKEAKRIRIEPQLLILIDLMSIGYTKAEAYSIAYSDNQVLSFEQNQSIREGLTKTERFNEVLNERTRTLRNRVIRPDGEEIELISTEDAAKEILKITQQLPEGSKEKGEMLLKYTELLRKNSQVDAESEDDSIRIYLPLKCHDCILYQNHQEKIDEQESID